MKNFLFLIAAFLMVFNVQAQDFSSCGNAVETSYGKIRLEVYALTQDEPMQTFLKQLDKLTEYVIEDNRSANCCLEQINLSGYEEYFKDENTHIYVNEVDGVIAAKMIIFRERVTGISINEYSGAIDLSQLGNSGVAK